MPLAAKLPNFLVIKDFLSDELHAALLSDTLASEAEYRSSKLGGVTNDGSRVSAYNETIRKSRVRRLPNTLELGFRDAVLERLDEALKQIRIKPPNPRKFEIEAVVSGDGALFKKHHDMGMKDKTSYRVVSAVYYYSAQPQAFTGGALRIYSLSGAEFTDVQPINNSIVLFPSMFPHEVMPVSVPSGRFDDSRFSVNCWLRKVISDQG